jgi:ATP-dependent DNA helicase RecG
MQRLDIQSLHFETLRVIIVSEVINMTYQESSIVELKETYSKSICKTVSAYANSEGGTIYIGIDDSGKVVGIDDLQSMRAKIENVINDSVTPRPTYRFNVLKDSGKNILEIVVSKGDVGPYYYNHRAYIRSDTSSIPLDGENLTRLILKSKNLTFDQMRADHQTFEFDVLKQRLDHVLNIKNASQEVLITLGLYQNKIYNNAAALLADHGNITSSCVDLVKYHLDMNAFIERHRMTNESILQYFDGAFDFFNKHYAPYQVIEGSRRVTKERVPKEAFREALANAIIHRDYLIKGCVGIAMFDNRIEIRSPGGLPEGIDYDLYLKGATSIPRNPIISNVFFRLGLIESFGTGVRRIIDAYRKNDSHPSFAVRTKQITVILPVLDYDYTRSNKTDAIISYLEAYPDAPRERIEKAIDADKSLVIRRLNELSEKGLIEIVGRGPKTTYRIASS